MQITICKTDLERIAEVLQGFIKDINHEAHNCNMHTYLRNPAERCQRNLITTHDIIISRQNVAAPVQR